VSVASAGTRTDVDTKYRAWGHGDMGFDKVGKAEKAGGGPLGYILPPSQIV
jgi:hypothetical protein